MVMPTKHGIVWLLVLIFSTASFAALELPNASLEEDYENDGIPDKWKVQKTTRVTLVTDKKSHGSKAAKFTAGYVLLSTDMKSEKPLPGQTLTFSFDACGSGEARLGVMLGFYVNAKGKTKFTYARMTWNRVLRPNFVTQRFKYTFPKTAIKNRVWLGIYCTTKKGIVWLDNFTMTAGVVTPAQRKKLVVVQREWGYMAGRLAKAMKLKPNNKSLQEMRRKVNTMLNRCSSDDLKLLNPQNNFTKEIEQFNAKINAIVTGGAKCSAWLSDAYVRMAPDEIVPAKLTKSSSLETLRNEYRAIGVNVANGTDKPQTFAITLDGLSKAADKIQIRKQVFLKTWYRKGKIVIADPIPLLKDNQLPLNPGQTVKLLVSFKVKSGTKGEYPVKIKVANQDLSVNLKVLSKALPTKPKMHHFQFIYPNIQPAMKYPELTAKDLAEHYCDGIEFPFLPSIVFNKDGSVNKSNFAASMQARWMKAYAAEKIKLGIFWEGVYKKFPMPGGKLMPFVDKNEVFYPAWKKAYTNLLTSWLKFSKEKGYGLDDYLILPDDEPSSRHEFMNAPGKLVLRAVETYKLTRKTEPKLKQLVTISDYASPKDVEAITPHVDIVMPVWPARTSITRWVPKGYNPRATFHNTIVPLFKAERKKRGLQIWSYTVDRGKTEPVLNSGRAYPICAVGVGYTGVATWAYNVTRGSSWDDTDKGMLDYSFIYNGCEGHPINKRENPTGEIIVPSIRWEAMRMGIQDAQIMLYLQDAMKKGKCNAATAAEIKKILAEANEYGRKLNFSYPKINSISKRIRTIIMKIK
jgi:hypothetical protein